MARDDDSGVEIPESLNRSLSLLPAGSEVRWRTTYGSFSREYGLGGILPESSEGGACSERRRSKTRLVAVIYSVALVLQVLIWFVLYRVAGYSDRTMSVACGVTLVLGLASALWLRLESRQMGLGTDKLAQAFAAAIVAHVLLVLAGWAVNASGGGISIFRSSYSLYAIANSWVLTAFGEELLFAGVIFTSLTRSRDRKLWMAVPLVAALFALWHFPGCLAIGLETNTLSFGVLGDLAINMASWLFFGAIYALSRNLWLVAIAHASMDYALLPMITRNPLTGFVFLILLMLGGWIAARVWGTSDRRASRVPRYLRHR